MSKLLDSDREQWQPSRGFNAYPDLVRWWHTCGDWIDSFRGQVGLACGIALIYILGYLGHPALPGNNDSYPGGWLGWWDQSLYFRTAAAISNGELSAASYLYPLGYPLLGALTWPAVPRHAFLVPDLVLTVGIALLLYRMIRRFLGPQETLLLIAAFVFLYRGTLSAGLVEPWSTIPTQFFAYVVVFVLVFSTPNTARIFLGAACVGMTYTCRAAEAACLLPMLWAAILCLPTWRRRLLVGAGAGGIIVLFLLGIVLLNYKMFGSLTSPYEATTRAGLTFGAFPLKWKMYSLFVDGHLFFRESEQMLLERYPFFLLCLPGAAMVVQRFGLRGFGLCCSIIVTYLLYLAFNDFWSRNLFRYHVIHYLIWTLPLIALFAYLGLRDGWRVPGIRWTFVSIPVLGGFLLCYRLVELPLEHVDAPPGGQVEIPSQLARRPDWLAFSGATTLPPKLFSGHRELQAFVDYVPRFDGSAVLLAPHVKMPITVRDTTLTAIDTGQLRSRFTLPRRIAASSLPKQPESFRAYNLGTRIQFGKDGESRRFCIRGWSYPQDQVTWIEGRSAVVLFDVPASHAFILRAAMAGLTRQPVLTAQNVEVLANGKKVADWQVADRKEYIAYIPGAVTFGGQLELEFKTPDATTPKSLGLNDDTRLLSVCVFSLTLEQSSEWK